MRVNRLLVAAVLLLASALAIAGSARAQTQEQRTGVRVVGQGQVAAPPDLAVITLGASVLRDRPDAACDRAEQLIAAATAAMRAQGVGERDIATSQLSLFQEFRPGTPDNPQPVLAGWRARHGLSVRLREFGRLGRVVSDAVAALEDAGEVQGIAFTVENPDARIDQARDAALVDAREKAERIAARLGFRLGAVTFVQEVSAPFPSPVRAPTPAPTVVPRPPGTAPFPAQITPGERVFTVTVEVHFAIAGGSLTASGAAP